MTPSPGILSFVKTFERCRLTAYLPTPNDKPTIGWGSTGPNIHLGMTWTQAEADERFAADCAVFGVGLSRVLGHAPTTQNQFDAMFSLDYNIGAGAFRTSTLLRYHMAGRYDECAAQFSRWNKQRGVVVNGLTARRLAEAHIYLGAPTTGG